MDDLWKLAEAQHALFARDQARALGVDRSDIARLIRRSIVEPWTDRVLRIAGAPQTADQRMMAAVLDAGGSPATRRAAKWVWNLPGATLGDRPAVARRRQRSTWPSSGGDHWPRLVPDHHLTVVRGIPVTTLPRTIFDLAALPDEARRLGRLIDTIHGKYPAILVALHQMLPELAARGRNGITVIRGLLDERPPDSVPRTGLERRFEHVLSNAGIAVPRMQIDLGGHAWIGRVDYYDDDRLIIYEVDSAAHHTSLTDRRNDELRDEAALAAGFREVVRITEEALWYEPWTVVETVREAQRRNPCRRARLA